MRIYGSGAAHHPLLGLQQGTSTQKSDLNLEIKAMNEEICQLKVKNQELFEKFDYLKAIIKEILVKLAAIEEQIGENGIVSVSQKSFEDIIEFRGYGKDTITALLYLEKRGILYVRDLKRLGIVFSFNRQYIRFLHKLGEIPGNEIRQAANGLWFVIKKQELEE